MDECDVSVIIPVHNTGQQANELAKKLLNSYGKIEVILVDDGSTDDSLKVLRGLKDKRAKIYHKKNGGPSSARNYGVKKAVGKYLLFVDSDDNVKEDFVEKMVLAMDDSTAMVVCGVKYCKLDNNSEEDVYLDSFSYKCGESNKDYAIRSMLKDGRMYPVFNKAFKNEIVKKADLKFDESIDYGEDTKFVMDYLDVAQGKIKLVLEPLYVYYAGTATSIARKLQTEWDNWRTCFKNLRKWIGKKPTWSQRKALVLIYLKWRASWLKAKFNV